MTFLHTSATQVIELCDWPTGRHPGSASTVNAYPAPPTAHAVGSIGYPQDPQDAISTSFRVVR